MLEKLMQAHKLQPSLGLVCLLELIEPKQSIHRSVCPF
jgi:hypothetical protein